MPELQALRDFSAVFRRVGSEYLWGWGGCLLWQFDVQLLVDEGTDELSRFVDAEYRRIDAEVVIVGTSPCAGRVEVVVTCALCVPILDSPQRSLPVNLLGFHDASRAVVGGCRDEDADHARVFAEDVVRHAADEDSRAFACHLFDDAALQGEQVFLGQLVGVEVAAAEEGLHCPEERVQESLALIVPLEDSASQAALFGCYREDFLIVVRDSQLFGQDVADLSAAAAQLAPDADGEWRVHGGVGGLHK